MTPPGDKDEVCFGVILLAVGFLRPWTTIPNVPQCFWRFWLHVQPIAVSSIWQVTKRMGGLECSRSGSQMSSGNHWVQKNCADSSRKRPKATISCLNDDFKLPGWKLQLLCVKKHEVIVTMAIRWADTKAMFSSNTEPSNTARHLWQLLESILSYRRL